MIIFSDVLFGKAIITITKKEKYSVRISQYTGVCDTVFENLDLNQALFKAREYVTFFEIIAYRDIKSNKERREIAFNVSRIFNRLRNLRG